MYVCHSLSQQGNTDMRINHTTHSDTLKQFHQLYRENAPVLIHFANRYVCDIQTAEDLVQDVFLNVWKKKVFLFMEEVRPYLFRSVRNACLDYLKHQSVKQDFMQTTLNQLSIEELYYNDDISLLYLEDDRLTSIYREIEQLPQRCKEIFTMSYLEEKKSTEIAEILQISRRTVEAQLYKALKQIRNALLPLFIFFLKIFISA